MKTLTELNRTTIETFKALDPKRFTELVNAHWELSERKAKAIVEEERRAFSHERKTMEEAGEQLLALYGAALEMAFGLMPYVPRAMRLQAIERVDASDEFKQPFVTVADDAADWSLPIGLERIGHGQFLGLADIARIAAENREPPSD